MKKYLVCLETEKLILELDSEAEEFIKICFPDLVSYVEVRT
jgi:hypothetical protein